MARVEFASRELIEGAAQSGAPEALFELGLLFSVGRDVEQNLVEAHKWFNLAALRGNAEARQYRAEISNEMSKAEVASAQKLARKWLSLH